MQTSKIAKVPGKFVCRKFLNGGALSIGKLSEKRAPT